MVRAPRSLRTVDGGDHLSRGPRGARTLARDARVARAGRDRHRGVVRRRPRVDRRLVGRSVGSRRVARAGSGRGGVRARHAHAPRRAGATAPPPGAGLVAYVLRAPVRGRVVRRRPRHRVPDVPVGRHARRRGVRRDRERESGGGRAHRGAVRPGARALRDRRVALGHAGAEPRARRPVGVDVGCGSAPDERRRAPRDRGHRRRRVVPGGRRVLVDVRGRRAGRGVHVGGRVEGRLAAPLAARAGGARAASAPRACRRLGRPLERSTGSAPRRGGAAARGGRLVGRVAHRLLGHARRLAGPDERTRRVRVLRRPGVRRAPVRPRAERAAARDRRVRRDPGRGCAGGLAAGRARGRRRAPAGAHARCARGGGPGRVADVGVARPRAARMTPVTRAGSIARRLLPFALAFLTVAGVTAAAFAGGAATRAQVEDPNDTKGHAGRPARLVRAGGGPAALDGRHVLARGPRS